MPAGERRLLKMLPRSIPRADRSIVRSSGEKELEEDDLKDSNRCELCLGKFEDVESAEGEWRGKTAEVKQMKRNNFCGKNII